MKLMPENANTKSNIMAKQSAGSNNVLEILSNKVECWINCQSSLLSLHSRSFLSHRSSTVLHGAKERF